MANFMSKHEIEQKIFESVSEDQSLRKKLIDEPRSTVEDIIKEGLSPEINLIVHEEDTNTLHIVLPPDIGQRPFFPNHLWGRYLDSKERSIEIKSTRS